MLDIDIHVDDGPLRDQYQVDRQLPSTCSNCMQRRDERRLGSFLVHRASANEDCA